MKTILSFLSSLAQNNNKTWFDKHKDEYKEANALFIEFALKLIEGISQFDPSVKGLTVKDCTYRIYRDLRFSTDKTPYKTHMGVFIAPNGKCGGHAGYYFHIEPAKEYYLLCSGLYIPEPKIIKSVREEILLNGKGFEDTIKKASGFEMDWQGALKRIPNGYPKEYQFAEYFRLKNFCILKSVDEKYVLSTNLLENLISDFSKTLDYNTLLNRAVDYALEEM